MQCLPYAQAKHSLDKLFEQLLVDVLREKPVDPLQFIIDSLSLGVEHAAQASDQPASLMPPHSTARLFKAHLLHNCVSAW
jgi:hypothetical protein